MTSVVTGANTTVLVLLLKFALLLTLNPVHAAPLHLLGVSWKNPPATALLGAAGVIDCVDNMGR